jgi:hypothetical protein
MEGHWMHEWLPGPE